MKEAIVFEASRNGYSIGQVKDGAMTVGDLIAILEDYDEDALVILSHDNGYTYGSISRFDSYNAYEDEDGDWEVERY